MARTRRKKKRTHLKAQEDPRLKATPRTMIFKRGGRATVLKDLEKDFRKVAMPFTAVNLKEQRNNSLKDFISVAGPLGISYFVIFTASEKSQYMKLAKPAQGPTITMKIHSFSLMHDVLSVQQRSRIPRNYLQKPPIVIMTNFENTQQHKLVSIFFQGLFPPINVRSVKLRQVQRALLISYDKEKDRIYLRHYTIQAQASGLPKDLKNLIGQRSVNDLSGIQDISDLLTKSGNVSESEGEDAKVMLSQDMGKGNQVQQQSKIKLYEIGPRMELEIIKVEEGLCEGKVLYHKYIQKSSDQVQQQDQQIKEKKALKEKRKQIQQENVRAKQKIEEAKKEQDQ